MVPGIVERSSELEHGVQRAGWEILRLETETLLEILRCYELLQELAHVRVDYPRLLSRRLDRFPISVSNKPRHSANLLLKKGHPRR